VALGRAIARQPSCFSMDEPSATFDAKSAHRYPAQIVFDLQSSSGNHHPLRHATNHGEAMTMAHRSPCSTPDGSNARHADAALTVAVESVRGPVHRSLADEPAAGAGGGWRRCSWAPALSVEGPSGQALIHYTSGAYEGAITGACGQKIS